MFLGSKFSEIGEVEKCPHPREPLSGTPTAQNGGWEMIVLWVPLTLPRYSFDAHFKDKGDNLRFLTPMSVQNVKKWQCSGELNWPWGLPRPLQKE